MSETLTAADTAVEQPAAPVTADAQSIAPLAANEQPAAPVTVDGTAPLTADSSDEALDAALAASPSLPGDAVNRADVAFNAALQALIANPVSGGGHPAHLLGFEQQRYWPRISQGVQSLSRLAAIAGANT